MAPEITDAAMCEFILSSGANLRTAMAVHRAFASVTVQLVSEIARRIEVALAAESGWEIVENTLASNPLGIYSIIKWAPSEWRAYGWGVGLSSQQSGAGKMMFGLHATATINPDRDRAKLRTKCPAMSDVDRARLAQALVPITASVGGGNRVSAWWPQYTDLPPGSRDWTNLDVLPKIAYAVGRSIEPDLVAGKKLDVFIVDAFLSAKTAIETVLALEKINPILEQDLAAT